MIEASPEDALRSFEEEPLPGGTGASGPVHRLLVPGLLLLLLSLFSGCRTFYLPPEVDERPSGAGSTPSWTVLDEGLDFYTFHDPSIPLALFALRVDLESDLWEFVFTPPGGRDAAAVQSGTFEPGPPDPLTGAIDYGFTLAGMKTTDFLAVEGCRAAVNGGPFRPYRWFFSGPGQKPAGLYFRDGILYGAPIKPFDALVLDAEGRFSIRPQADYPFEGEFLLGGFLRLLDAGRILPGDEGIFQPRTAVGLSADGRYIYFLVADGRRSGYSRGLTQRETAEQLLFLGASEGLNLDGGGSSVMVLEENRIPRIINRPVNRRGFPERIVATHIGIRKKRVETESHSQDD